MPNLLGPQPHAGMSSAGQVSRCLRQTMANLAGTVNAQVPRARRTRKTGRQSCHTAGCPAHGTQCAHVPPARGRAGPTAPEAHGNRRELRHLRLVPAHLSEAGRDRPREARRTQRTRTRPAERADAGDRAQRDGGRDPRVPRPTSRGTTRTPNDLHLHCPGLPRPARSRPTLVQIAAGSHGPVDALRCEPDVAHRPIQRTTERDRAGRSRHYLV